MSGIFSGYGNFYRSPWYWPNSRCGRGNRFFLLWIGLSLLVLAAGSYIYLNKSIEELAAEKARVPGMYTTSLHETTNVMNENRQSLDDKGSGDLWQKLQQTLAVERVHHSGDEKIIERGIARKNLSQVKRLLNTLKQQGLRGEDLYAEAGEQLMAAHGPAALKMLDGYRRLDEALAKEDLDDMSPEERLKYLHQTRQAAFGEEMAHMLFFKDEARQQYYLDERALKEDPDLSEEMKAERIQELRKKLRVDLASQGTTIQFADERAQALEERLRERYGESVETMTSEEREQAIWDMYSEELPPEVMEKVKEMKSRLAKGT